MNEREAAGIWEKTLSMVSDVVDEKSFQMWFRPLRFVSINNSTLNIEAPSQLFVDWINRNYRTIIDQSLSYISKEKITIDFSVSKTKSTTKKNKQSPTLFSKYHDDYATYINPNYTFERFVVGSGNEFAHAAAIAVAQSPGKVYNPLFVYGGVGLGKTHLLQAIGNELIKNHNHRKTYYISSEKFTNELIDAIQKKTTEKFHKKYRSLDTLLIDDIHFIAGKESTEVEFFHTFNELYNSHRQIVISSDRPPEEIPTLEKRLVSRFRWGLVADIQPPDFETRMAILRNKAMYEGYTVPEEILVYICEGITTNIRELEGALIRVVAYSSLNEKKINLTIAKELFKDLIKKEEHPKPITIDLIKDKVSQFFNVKPTDMNSKKRNSIIAYPRQIAMYIARELTNFSLPAIGNNFGGRDHTTVLHAYTKIKKKREKDKNFDSMIRKIIESIRCG